jgi:MinD superfamily P-loop ATPase
MAEEEKKKVRRPLGHARLKPGKCIACGARCQSECKADAVEMNDKGEPHRLPPLCPYLSCRSHRNLLHAGRTENSGRIGKAKGTGKTGDASG